MLDPNAPKRANKDIDVPRTFMTPAYFEEIENGTFAMFRDITVETNEKGEDGKPLREKWGKRIGPIFLCKEAGKGEEPDFTTSRADGNVLLLIKLPPDEGSQK